MTVKTHEYYDCIESDENQLFVDGYTDKVYFETLTYEGDEGGAFLDREKVELLILQLNKWLDDTF